MSRGIIPQRGGTGSGVDQTARDSANARIKALTARSVQTTSFTAAPQTMYAVDATAGAVVVTLPATNTATDLIVIQKTDATANLVSYTGTVNSTDGFTGSLRTQSQAKTFQGDGKGNWNIVAGDVSVAALDNRYPTLVNGIVSTSQIPVNSNVVMVYHGANAATTRPTTSNPVLWVGSVTPTNFASGDLYATTAQSADTTAPTVPGTPAATAGATSASVAFAASTDNVGVAGYRVYGSSDGYASILATGTSSPITVTGLAAGTAIAFEVVAYDAAGNASAKSTASNSVTPTASTDTTPPSVPTGLTAGTPTSSSVPLTWTASTDNVGVTQYKVRRGGTVVGNPTTNSYTDTALTASTAYSYTVSALDAAGNESAQTAAVNATTAAPAATDLPTTNLQADYNPANITGVSNGGTVSTVPDPIGGFNLTAAGAPKLATNALNGKPVVTLDGVSAALANTAISDTLNTEFYVIRYNSLVAGALAVAGAAPTRNIQNSNATAGSAVWNFYSGSPVLTSSSQVVAGAWVVISVTWNGSSSIARVNGVSTTLATGTNGRTGIYFGETATGTNFAQIDIARAAIYNTVLTPSQVLAVEAVLKADYGISF